MDMHIPVQGAKRLQAEFKYLTKQIAAGTVTQMHDLTPVTDNVFKWQARHLLLVCASLLAESRPLLAAGPAFA